MKNTPVTFKDGKELIVHHNDDLTQDELDQLKELTSVEFKAVLLSTGRFKAIPMKDNPFLTPH